MNGMLKPSPHVLGAAALSVMFSSLRAKLALIVAVAVIIAMMLAAVLNGWRAADQRFALAKTELEGMVATLSAAVGPALADGQARKVQSILRAVRRMPRVKHVRVADNVGRPIAGFGSGIVLVRDVSKARSSNQHSLFELLSLKTFSVDMPVMHGGVAVGSLSLVGDVSHLRRALWEGLGAAGLIGVLASVVGFLITLRLQNRVTSPIIELTYAMRDVQRSHDFSRTVARTSADETGALVDAFNDMLGQIRARDDALSRHRDTLEETVAERTRDLRAATEDAQKANAAKSDFLATMSHEIRTPMNGMLVMAELLSAGGLSPRLKRYADVIVSSGQSLLSIINDILDFSKVEAGRMELESVPVNPSDLVDQVSRLFAERALTKGLDIAAIVEADVPKTIAADPVRLNQVLSNLVNNALKFTETGGVRIRVSQSPRTSEDGIKSCALQISVSDSGIGIPENKLATIFDAFSQADQSTTRKFGGTGIGLSICERLVTCMRGNISVASEVGHGSTFTISIPVPILETHAVREADDTSTLPVIIALDESPTRDALATYVELAGLRAQCIPAFDIDNAKFAEAAAVITNPQAVKETASSELEDCKVIALSGLGSSDTDRLLDSGHADAALSWPVSRDETVGLLCKLRTGSSLNDRFVDRRNRRVEDVPAFANVRILAADDSIVNREVLKEALHRLNVDVTSVENGQEAVDAIQREPFDLVFLDGSMPVMDGFEAARAIRAWEQETHREPLPVIALTAHVIGKQSELWRDAGMSDCITKPFTLKSIEACLRKWLPVSNNETQQSKPASARLLLDQETIDNLLEMQNSDGGLVDRVIDLYVAHAPQAIGDLETSAAKRDPRAIAEAAHALKSLSLNIGARRVADLCEEIEGNARSNDQILSDQQLATVRQALRESIAALVEFKVPPANSIAAEA